MVPGHPTTSPGEHVSEGGAHDHPPDCNRPLDRIAVGLGEDADLHLAAALPDEARNRVGQDGRLGMPARLKHKRTRMLVEEPHHLLEVERVDMVGDVLGERDVIGSCQCSHEGAVLVHWMPPANRPFQVSTRAKSSAGLRLSRGCSVATTG